ncbi:MAG: ThiF family adenylyltransferase [Legionellales bacterium]|nr:ThiF family adenylyltransferase [Legionellales bacterium]
MKNTSRPILKAMVEYYTSEDKIYFFKSPGTAIELGDSKGFIKTVCQLLDGKKTVKEIEEILNHTHPKEVSYLNDLLTSLDKAYLLEDNVILNSKEFSPYEIERWERNIEFFGAYTSSSHNKFNYQKKLQNTKVTLLGLGGAGSHILYELAALGIHQIQAVDFDKIELSNLNRQIIYDESDVGLRKVDIAKRKIKAFLPNAKLNFINIKISSNDDVSNIISGQEFVISVIDQPRNQILNWVNQACINEKVPFICGALDWKYCFFYSVIPGKSGCIECWKNSARESGTLFLDFIENDNFVSSRIPNITIAPLVSILTGLMLSEFIKITTDILAPNALGNLIVYDFQSNKLLVKETWEKMSSCKICGNI